MQASPQVYEAKSSSSSQAPSHGNSVYLASPGTPKGGVTALAEDDALQGFMDVADAVLTDLRKGNLNELIDTAYELVKEAGDPLDMPSRIAALERWRGIGAILGKLLLTDASSDERQCADLDTVNALARGLVGHQLDKAVRFSVGYGIGLAGQHLPVFEALPVDKLPNEFLVFGYRRAVLDQLGQYEAPVVPKEDLILPRAYDLRLMRFRTLSQIPEAADFVSNATAELRRLSTMPASVQDEFERLLLRHDGPAGAPLQTSSVAATDDKKGLTASPDRILGDAELGALVDWPLRADFVRLRDRALAAATVGDHSATLTKAERLRGFYLAYAEELSDFVFRKVGREGLTPALISALMGNREVLEQEVAGLRQLPKLHPDLVFPAGEQAELEQMLEQLSGNISDRLASVLT